MGANGHVIFLPTCVPSHHICKIHCNCEPTGMKYLGTPSMPADIYVLRFERSSQQPLNILRCMHARQTYMKFACKCASPTACSILRTCVCRRTYMFAASSDLQTAFNILALHACRPTYMFYRFERSSPQPWNIWACMRAGLTYMFYHFKRSSPQPWNIWCAACMPADI